MIVKIEKGVPVKSKKGNLRQLVSQMQVGDSVFFTNNEITQMRTFRQYLYEDTIETPYRALSRRTEDGIRIWKVLRKDHE